MSDESTLSDARLRALLDHSPLVLVEWSATLTVQGWSRQAERTFGWRADEVLGRRLGEFPWVHPLDQDQVNGVVRDLFLPGSTCVPSRNRNLTRAGDVVWMEWYNSVLHDPHGRIVALQSVGLDVTERVQTEEELRRRVDEVDRLMHFMPIAVIRAGDPACRHVTGNPAAHALLHVPLGRNVSKTAPPGEVPTSYQAFQHGVEVPPEDLPMQRACRDGVEVRDAEFELRYADGTARHIYCYATPVFASGEVSGCLFAALDITERKRAEQDLARAEARFRTLADAMPHLVWVADESGRIVYVNRQWRELTGAGPDEPMATHWVAFVHPADIDGLAAAWQHALATTTALEQEYRLRRADGSFGWQMVRATPALDEHGTLVGWYGSSSDIDRPQRLAEALRDADRRKDEFLATLAHELRNPLAPIRTAVQVLKGAAPTDARLAWGHDVIARQVAHMARLLDDLLDVSRITRSQLALQVTRVPLSAVLGSAIETSRPAIEAHGHDLRVELPEHDPTLDADPVRLAQVFSNLLNNAAKYTDDGGRIVVRATTDGGRVRVSVADTGIGFEAGLVPSLFEMFTRADQAVARADGGLGIGLSLVKALVELHGGTVTAHSEGPGTGSEFVVDLPLAASASASASLDVVPAATGRRRRVLIADDNVDAADALAMLLEMDGHIVQVAHDGTTALALAGDFGPDMAVLDIGMPGLDGYETARRIRAEAWGDGITLVALTGWGQAEDRERALAAGFDVHLVKPFAPEQLAATLAAAPPARQRTPIA